MQDYMLNSFSPRVLNGALLAVGWLGLAAAPALAQTKNPDRDAYFGETHVHTSWSLDAWLIGNRLTDPGDAYKYFKGEPIKHPLGLRGQDRHAARLGGRHRPLRVRRRDQARQRSGSPISKLPAAQPLIIKAKTPAGDGADLRCTASRF